MATASENIYIHSDIDRSYLDGYVLIITAVIVFLAAFFIQQRIFFVIQYNPRNIVAELSGLIILMILAGFMVVTIYIGWQQQNLVKLRLEGIKSSSERVKNYLTQNYPTVSFE